jgi:Cft2 family RNA processing exonuclease
MKKVSLREYAKLHKLSYFNVMKMVKGGDVKSVTEIEDDKEVQYVLVEEEQEKRVSESIIETSAQKLTLKEENILLKKEIERLKVELEKCNKRTVLA